MRFSDEDGKSIAPNADQMLGFMNTEVNKSLFLPSKIL